MLDWFYEEQEEKNWDFDHVRQCRACQGYYEKLGTIEQELPREPLEFQASEAFIRTLEDKVREEGVRRGESRDKRRMLKELGAFPAVALFLLLAMGSLFYYGIGPSFIQVQLTGLILFPLIIPILGALEKNRQRGRDIYGS